MAAIVGMTLAGVVGAAPILDQEQAVVEYGFYFDLGETRWQEFRPTLPVLEQVDLFIGREGSPGDILVQVRGEEGAMFLWGTAVPEGSIPSGDSWISLDVPSVLLVVDEPFRLYVSATEEAGGLDRYVWMGDKSSAYAQGISSVESAWPGYDFCFRTYGESDAAIPAPGAILLGTVGAGLVGWLRRGRLL